jgi:RimJ/RimL family protein N-acetyltransferase
MSFEIVTDRLKLRPASADDVAGLHALVSDFEVVKQTATWPWPADPAFTATRATPMDPRRGVAGPVFAGAALVGMMGLHAASDDTAQNAELGYMFRRDDWGKGYATEMARALISHCWDRYDWPAIEAAVFVANPASARVLEKLGFVEGPGGIGASTARGGQFAIRRFRLARP